MKARVKPAACHFESQVKKFSSFHQHFELPDSMKLLLWPFHLHSRLVSSASYSTCIEVWGVPSPACQAVWRRLARMPDRTFSARFWHSSSLATARRLTVPTMVVLGTTTALDRSLSLVFPVIHRGIVFPRCAPNCLQSQRVAKKGTRWGPMCSLHDWAGCLSLIRWAAKNSWKTSGGSVCWLWIAALPYLSLARSIFRIPWLLPRWEYGDLFIELFYIIQIWMNRSK